MNSGIESVFSYGQGCGFSEGPSPGSCRLYKVCRKKQNRQRYKRMALENSNLPIPVSVLRTATFFETGLLYHTLSFENIISGYHNKMEWYNHELSVALHATQLPLSQLNFKVQVISKLNYLKWSRYLSIGYCIKQRNFT